MSGDHCQSNQGTQSPEEQSDLSTSPIPETPIAVERYNYLPHSLSSLYASLISIGATLPTMHS